ncbi:hypothetical protein IWX91DRAFT_167865 [Phyllosticta citricarpa]
METNGTGAPNGRRASLSRISIYPSRINTHRPTFNPKARINPNKSPNKSQQKKKEKKKKKATTNSAVRRCIDFATPFFLHYLLFSILLLRRSTLQFPISCIGGKRFFFFLLFSFSPFLLFFFFFATASASWRVDLACFVECQNISLRTCVCQMGV